MKKRRKLVMGIFMGLVTVVVIFLCSLLYILNEEPRTIIDEEYHYSVNLDTILDDLSQGETDVFFPQIDKPDADPKREFRAWTADDYFLVAEAALQMIWGETVGDWHIYLAIYDWECDNLSVGPSVAHIGFFMAEDINGQILQYSSYITINLLDNYISVSKEIVKLPVLEKSWRKNGVSPSHLVVPVQEILDIAEMNGGANFRRELNNKCAVSVFINPDTVRFDGNWKVSYKGLGGTAKFIIAPDSGKLIEYGSPSP